MRATSTRTWSLALATAMVEFGVRSRVSSSMAAVYGDPAVLLAEAQRARAELAWEPESSDLETIIEHAWRWEQEVSKGGSVS